MARPLHTFLLGMVGAVASAEDMASIYYPHRTAGVASIPLAEEGYASPPPISFPAGADPSKATFIRLQPLEGKTLAPTDLRIRSVYPGAESGDHTPQPESRKLKVAGPGCRETDVAFWGHDLAWRYADDPEQCPGLCEAFGNGCQTWTYVPQEKICFLKPESAAENRVSAFGHTSGRRCCEADAAAGKCSLVPTGPACYTPRVQHIGYKIKTLPNVLTAEDCQLQCRTNSACVAFSWQKRGGQDCSLHYNEAAVEDYIVDIHISGPATCPGQEQPKYDVLCLHRGRRLFGPDLYPPIIGLPDAERCQMECRNFPNCVMFTFYQSIGASLCYLKADYYEHDVDGEFVIGPPSCPVPVYREGLAFRGSQKPATFAWVVAPSTITPPDGPIVPPSPRQSELLRLRAAQDAAHRLAHPPPASNEVQPTGSPTQESEAPIIVETSGAPLVQDPAHTLHVTVVHPTEGTARLVDIPLTPESKRIASEALAYGGNFIAISMPTTIEDVRSSDPPTTPPTPAPKASPGLESLVENARGIEEPQRMLQEVPVEKEGPATTNPPTPPVAPVLLVGRGIFREPPEGAQ